ncbi:MAG: DUF5667 domain-containing protein [Candidatus Pacebacteria bacterium]|nr:DUF5667 domain-containing protein [Candidatus Paceibacterota bacterium]
MQEDIIYKLKALQSVEPEGKWVAETERKLMRKASVFGVKNDILLSSNDIFARKTKTNIFSFFPNRVAVSFASLAIVFTGGVLTVGASQSSLPGETLYSVKKAGEQVALAVASEQDKPKVEIQQAGKRLEELVQISQKSSDTEQHKKVEQLVTDFEAKVNSANERLVQLSQSGGAEKTKIVDAAKVVNSQSEKYSEVLEKTNASLPEVVKEKVAEKVESAAKTTQKTNLEALLVIVESSDNQIDEETTAKIQKKVDGIEVKVKALEEKEAAAVVAANCAEGNGQSIVTSVINGMASSESATITVEAKVELEKTKESMKNNNLADTLKGVATVEEMTEAAENASAEQDLENTGSAEGSSSSIAKEGNNDETENVDQDNPSIIDGSAWLE